MSTLKEKTQVILVDQIHLFDLKGDFLLHKANFLWMTPYLRIRSRAAGANNTAT